MKTPLALALMLAVVSPCVAKADVPPPQLADVNESYHLLEQSAYHPVSNTTLVQAARAAILDEASKHHASVNLRDLPDTTDEDATIAWLDNAVTSAASASHVSATTFAYDAIDGMAKSVGDRWTQFMTPDEYRAFNAA